MRYFSKPSSLERLSLEARVLYTGFCLFMLLGYASSGWLYLDDDLGVSASSARRYYLGERAAESNPAIAGARGPLLEVPPELDRAGAAPQTEGMRFEKPPRQVMETFHFHFLTVPVCLLIIGHLFMMCGLSTRTKASIIALASAATLVHLVLPPLIRFVAPGLAVALFPSAFVMGSLWAILTAWPVVEMWRPRPASREPSSAIGAGSE